MINIRSATPADISAIKQIYDVLFSSKAAHHYCETREIKIKKEEIKLFIQEMIAGEHSVVLLAESSSTVLGFIILEQHKTPLQTYLPPYNFSYIIDLAIQQSLEQHSIISMKLINAGKQWAMTQNSEYIELGI